METLTELQISIDRNKMQRDKTLHAVCKLLMAADMTPHWKCSLASSAGGFILQSLVFSSKLVLCFFYVL